MIATISFSIVWAYISRMCGGLRPNLPLGLEQWLYALPTFLLYPFISWWVIPCYFLDLYSKRMGHGRGISLKEPMDPESNPEKIEILTLWLIDKIPMYWYKCLILSLTGLVGVILPSILLWVYGHELLALAVLLGGFIGKPLGYIIGWEIFPKHTVRTEEENQKIVWQENTAIGELLTGFFNKLPIFYGYFVLTLGVILG